MAEIISAIGNSMVQILTVISTFIVSGGLAAVVKYRKDKKEAQLDRDNLRVKQVEHESEIAKQKKEISELKKYICYRKQCPHRLKVNKANNKSKRKKSVPNEELQDNIDNNCGE